jgi:hypothetical protein
MAGWQMRMSFSLIANGFPTLKPRPRFAVQRAIELDPTLAEPHAALAVRAEDLDGKKREYSLVSMTPRQDQTSAENASPK